MNRRRALAIAGTVTASAAGAALAFSANVGLLGFSRADTSALGELQADQPLTLTADERPPTSMDTTTTTLPPDVVVQYEDVIVQDPPPPSPSPAAGVAATNPGTDEVDGPEMDDGATSTTVTTATTIADQSTTSTTIASEDHESDHEDDGVVEIEHEGAEDDD